MEIEFQDGTDATAVISGEADADNCRRIGEVLLGHGYESSTLELDLGRLTFMDSSAVSELLSVHSGLAENGVTMTIVEASPAVRRVLEITGLLGTFGLAETN